MGRAHHDLEFIPMISDLIFRKGENVKIRQYGDWRGELAFQSSAAPPEDLGIAPSSHMVALNCP